MAVTQGSLTELPFKDKQFDLICAFDVIEHIEEDGKAVKEINRVLRNEGKYFVTVPAYQFLWSEHDEVNYHFRRYTMKGLKKLFERGELEVDTKSYFNTILFPPIALIRFLSKAFHKKKKVEEKNLSDFEKYSLDKILYKIFRLEKIALSKGISFPFGVSILMVGSKK